MMKDDTKRKSLSSALLVKLFVCEALPFYLQRPQGTQQETSTGWSQLQFQALATLQPNYESVFLSLLYSIQNTFNTFSKRFHRLPNSMMLRVCSWLLTSSSTEQVALAVLEIHITSQIHWDNEDIYIYISSLNFPSFKKTLNKLPWQLHILLFLRHISRSYVSSSITSGCLLLLLFTHLTNLRIGAGWKAGIHLIECCFPPFWEWSILSMQSDLSRKKSIKICTVLPAGLVSTKRRLRAECVLGLARTQPQNSHAPAHRTANWPFDYHFRGTGQHFSQIAEMQFPTEAQAK